MRPICLHDDLRGLVDLWLYLFVPVRTSDPSLPKITENGATPSVVSGMPKVSRCVDCSLIVYYLARTGTIPLSFLKVCEDARILYGQHEVTQFDI